jgi:hypothetical protein
MEAKRRALDGIGERQRAADAKRMEKAEQEQRAAGAAPVAVVQ